MEDLRKYTFDEDFHSEGLSLKCPHCGSSLVLNPETGNFSCETCGSNFTKQELERKTVKKEDETFDEQVKEYTCPSCGASIITDENTSTDYCAYCGSHVVLKGRISGQIKPNLIMPFKISKENAKQILKDELKKYGYIPKSFFEEANLDKISGIYYPFWEADVDAEGEINAECTKVRTWVAGDRKYTETKFYDVSRSGDIHLEDISVNALKSADKSLIEGVLPFPIDGHIPFDMTYMSGFYAKKNDLTYDDVKPEISQKINNYSVGVLKSTMRNYTTIMVKNKNINIKNEHKDYTLLPIWILSYSYNNKNYTFAINGITGKMFGDLPLSKTKLRLSFFGIAAALFFLLSLIGGLFLWAKISKIKRNQPHLHQKLHLLF